MCEKKKMFGKEAKVFKLRCSLLKRREEHTFRITTVESYHHSKLQIKAMKRNGLQQYQFLRAGGLARSDHISFIVNKADEVLESMKDGEKGKVENREKEKKNESGQEGGEEENLGLYDIHKLLQEEAPFELQPFDKHFTCTLQYNSEAEYERILTWAHESTSGGILKFAKEDSKTAEQVASDQMRELEELAEFRRKLLHLSTLS